MPTILEREALDPPSDSPRTAPTPYAENEEAERVEYGFDLPKAVVAPNAPKKCVVKSHGEIAA
jgi:hypothetical protein